MYFSNNINFQYFFFDTYPGYFLQALPFALIGGAVYAVSQSRSKTRISVPSIILPSLFVSYMTGLLYLTLLEPIISDIYYFLFYHMPSGKGQHWFTFEYNLIPDFFYRFDGENIGNILMYLPFGFLHPSFRKDRPWKTILAGMSVSIGIELLQPVFGRRFDINDIILNGIGVIASTGIYYLFKRIIATGSLSFGK